MATVPAIGIDLGTTYTCVAVLRNGKIEIIPNDKGFNTTPSYVAFTKVERLIGQDAKSQAAMNAVNTIYDAKRLIGRNFHDESVQSDMERWPFKVVNDDGKPKIQVEENGEIKLKCPEEISSMILARMKDIAKGYLGISESCNDPIKAVITVPAYFNDSQRQATITAGTIAGLEVLSIINEPTAAAIAYGMDIKGQGKRTVLIYDLGGGTFDISILNINDGIFEVLSTTGDTHLGGEDFDNLMVDHFVKQFKEEYKKDLTSSKIALKRLKNACEKAKIQLSTCIQCRIDIPALFEGNDFQPTLSRSCFEDMNDKYFTGTLEHVKKALLDAKLDKAEIQDIVLIGGSTRIPKIQSLLQDFFNRDTLVKHIHPDEAVAKGAALQAANLIGNGTKDIQDMRLLDVNSLSLGIETVGGIMSVLIPRNTTLPTCQRKTYTTECDNQTSVRIKVYEGECELTEANNLLGQFELCGIPPAPRSVPKIEVTFFIDSNGILNVSAVDKDTGNSNSITITKNNGGLSDEDIERMVKNAMKYRAADKKKNSKVSIMNALQNYIYYVRSVVENDWKDKISEGNRQKVIEKADETMKWLKGDQLASNEEYEKKHLELKDLMAWCQTEIDRASTRWGWTKNKFSDLLKRW